LLSVFQITPVSKTTSNNLKNNKKSLINKFLDGEEISEDQRNILIEKALNTKISIKDPFNQNDVWRTKYFTTEENDKENPVEYTDTADKEKGFEKAKEILKANQQIGSDDSFKQALKSVPKKKYSPKPIKQPVKLQTKIIKKTFTPELKKRMQDYLKVGFFPDSVDTEDAEDIENFLNIQDSFHLGSKEQRQSNNNRHNKINSGENHPKLYPRDQIEDKKNNNGQNEINSAENRPKLQSINKIENITFKKSDNLQKHSIIEEMQQNNDILEKITFKKISNLKKHYSKKQIDKFYQQILVMTKSSVLKFAEFHNIELYFLLFIELLYENNKKPIRSFIELFRVFYFFISNMFFCQKKERCFYLNINKNSFNKKLYFKIRNNEGLTYKEQQAQQFFNFRDMETKEENGVTLNKLKFVLSLINSINLMTMIKGHVDKKLRKNISTTFELNNLEDISTENTTIQTILMILYITHKPKTLNFAQLKDKRYTPEGKLKEIKHGKPTKGNNLIIPLNDDKELTKNPKLLKQLLVEKFKEMSLSSELVKYSYFTRFCSYEKNLNNRLSNFITYTDKKVVEKFEEQLGGTEYDLSASQINIPFLVTTGKPYPGDFYTNLEKFSDIEEKDRSSLRSLYKVFALPILSTEDKKELEGVIFSQLQEAGIYRYKPCEKKSYKKAPKTQEEYENRLGEIKEYENKVSQSYFEQDMKWKKFCRRTGYPLEKDKNGRYIRPDIDNKKVADALVKLTKPIKDVCFHGPEGILKIQKIESLWIDSIIENYILPYKVFPILKYDSFFYYNKDKEFVEKLAKEKFTEICNTYGKTILKEYLQEPRKTDEEIPVSDTVKEFIIEKEKIDYNSFLKKFKENDIEKDKKNISLPDTEIKKKFTILDKKNFESINNKKLNNNNINNFLISNTFSIRRNKKEGTKYIVNNINDNKYRIVKSDKDKKAWQKTTEKLINYLKLINKKLINNNKSINNIKLINKLNNNVNNINKYIFNVCRGVEYRFFQFSKNKIFRKSLNLIPSPAIRGSPV